MLRTLFSYSSSKLKLGLISQGCEQHDQYRAVGAGRRGMPPPQILKDHFTLFQPGWQIVPINLLLAPQVFRSSYCPASLGITQHCVPEFLRYIQLMTPLIFVT